jgi:predicted flap endonuclease-1-like 5' DNA nuclease
MSVREPLNVEENAVAAVAGLGILFAMVAGILIGFGDDSDAVNTLFLVGLGLVVLGVAGWLAVLRPWEQYDDLQTPLYKGHHHAAEEAAPAPEIRTTVEDPLSEPTSGTVVGAVVEPETAPPQQPNTTTTTSAPPAEPVVEPEVVEIEHVVEHPAETAPAEVEATGDDDLQMIEGIGNKSEQALKEYGITTFAQLAAYDPFELERLVKEELSVRLVGSTIAWVRQAKLAAAGDLTALEQLQERVTSGYLYDDLTQIVGIDEAAQDALYEAKIRAFDNLAVAPAETLQAALESAGIEGASHVESWPQQAKFIVDGDLSGLADYQANL